MMQFSLSGQNKFAAQTKNLSLDYWTHLACVANTTNLCIYVNGTRQACSSLLGGLSFPYNPVTTLVGNTAVNGTAGLWGCLDELKIYDHALSDDQLSALANPTAANMPPSVVIGKD